MKIIKKEVKMEIAEIKYINERTIEITGELDIDLKAENIHIGCCSDEDITYDCRNYANVEINTYPHILLSDLPELFNWITKNTQRRSVEIETDYRPWDTEEEWKKCGAKWMVKPKKYVHIPVESNWKVTLERLD